MKEVIIIIITTQYYLWITLFVVVILKPLLHKNFPFFMNSNFVKYHRKIEGLSSEDLKE